MQDAADEITLRDEEGALRADFLHAVEAALEKSLKDRPAGSACYLL